MTPACYSLGDLLDHRPINSHLACSKTQAYSLGDLFNHRPINSQLKFCAESNRKVIVIYKNIYKKINWKF